MKKKVTVLTVAVLCAASMAVGAASSGLIEKVTSELRPDFKIVIDGQERTFKDVNGNVVYPMLYEGTTYLPVRAIGEIMGKTVYWYEDDKKIELKDEKTTVTDADVIVPSSPTAKPSNGEITEEEAKNIALEKAGLKASEVKFTRVKLEMDDGVRVYDVDFTKDNVEYNADVRVSDGVIVSWDVDDYNHINQTTPPEQSTGDIGVEKAKEIALNKAGLSAGEVVFTEASLDYDDGRKVYEIEFKKDRTEYSAEVLASDGTIVSWDVDYDD